LILLYYIQFEKDICTGKTHELWNVFFSFQASQILEEHMSMQKIIALDLEGTLISNAVSQIPRPGLFNFLEEAHGLAGRVVMFTTVKEDLFRKIAALLASENVVPAWFPSIGFIAWEGRTKNLEWISDSKVEACLLVDDNPVYIHPGQESQWIHIEPFMAPYPASDNELSRVIQVIRKKIRQMD
jgi:hypothetical protein